MKYFVVLMRDDALLGNRRGLRSQTLVTEQGLSDEKSAYKWIKMKKSIYGIQNNTYYKVIKAKEPPANWSESYELKTLIYFKRENIMIREFSLEHSWVEYWGGHFPYYIYEKPACGGSAWICRRTKTLEAAIDECEFRNRVVESLLRDKAANKEWEKHQAELKKEEYERLRREEYLAKLRPFALEHKVIVKKGRRGKSKEQMHKRKKAEFKRRAKRSNKCIY